MLATNPNRVLSGLNSEDAAARPAVRSDFWITQVSWPTKGQSRGHPQSSQVMMIAVVLQYELPSGFVQVLFPTASTIDATHEGPPVVFTLPI